MLERILIVVSAALIAAPAVAAGGHTDGAARADAITRFAVSGKSAKVFAEQIDAILQIQGVADLVKLGPGGEALLKKLQGGIRAAKDYGDRKGLASLVPMVNIRLDANHQLVVSNLPNAPMLHVKSGFAAAGTTTRGEMEWYYRFFSRRDGGADDYFKSLLFFSVAGSGESEVFLVVRNPLYGTGHDLPDALKPRLIENIIGPGSR